MKVGKVVGSVRATREAPCLRGQQFLVVQCQGDNIVAADQVGAKTGERVLLTIGDSAARYSMEAPVDAAVVAVLESAED